MKRIFTLLIIILAVYSAQGQAYNNEWIDYNKTYYKFFVANDGLLRISQSALNTIGLANTPAEHFQLWRNGEQVPVYTSVATGPLGAGGYIEFWGKKNDGAPDKILYRDVDYQINDKVSLFTDTASYFLTVNTNAAQNLRLINTPNNVAGNTLPADAFLNYTYNYAYKSRVNPGYAVVVGEYVYSSSFDKGEGWTSLEVQPNGSLTGAFSDIKLYTGPGASQPRFRITSSGNTINPRNVSVRINGFEIVNYEMNYFEYAKIDTAFDITYINQGNNSANITISNMSSISNDRMVVGQYEMTYPRRFDFGNANAFDFELAANTNGNYLEITNFNYGTQPPVLWDLTNGKRYVCDISNAPQIRVVLQPSSVKRKLLLISQDPGLYQQVTAFQQRNFVNINNTANQGDYLIISHPSLTTGTNPVEEYRTYRSSVQGGNHNAKVYMIDQLVDQFAFGIKQNPLSIRNLLRYGRDYFDVKPKYAFIIGKGVTYNQYLFQQGTASQPSLDRLALVPTFGQPGSDHLLTSVYGNGLPLTSIGRLSAIEPSEVSIYLDKVKEYELAQKTPSPLTADKAWMKNVVHVVGASDETLGSILINYMNKYSQIISDTLFGAHVSSFAKTSSSAVESVADQRLSDLFAEGISLLTYFGHSSASTLEFNLDNPDRYNNQGKYPVFNVMGCNAGNFFNYNPLRFSVKETLSEKFVLAPQRGAIAFIASTHFGIVHYLDIYNTRTYTALSTTHYQKTLGQLLDESITQTYNLTTQNDYYARFHCEQTSLHGDPVLRMNTHPKPDYVIEDQMVKVEPVFISVAETNFKITAGMLNIGMAVNKDIVVTLKRQYPDLSSQIIQRDTIPGIRYSDTLRYTIPIVPTRDKGLNRLTITLDAANAVDEIYETNNEITKDVFIFEDEARPVYPYNFAIVKNQNIKLIASSANPFATLKQYTMELDTTEFFNSPFKVTRSVTSTGGILEFTPGITFTDSTVYYWRVAPVPSSGAPSWNKSSFVYLPSLDYGFNQSHFYQHTKSANSDIVYDSATRKWKFGLVDNNIFLRLGTWARSCVQEACISVAFNGDPAIRVTNFFQSLVFNVFDPVTFEPWHNVDQGVPVVFPTNLGKGLYGSASPVFFGIERPYNFEFRYTDTSWRRKAMDFMRDYVPDGYYVVVRNMTLDPTQFTNTAQFPVAYVNDWKADEAIHGAGQTIYHYLKNAGFSGVDSFYRARQFGFVYKKNDPTFTPQWVVSDGVLDQPTLSVDCPTPDTLGYLTSPLFGPAKAWKRLYWRGNASETAAGDNPKITVLGVNSTGAETVLFDGINLTQQDFDVSSINAAQYPYVKLVLRNSDSVNYTPYQLRYWRLTYDPVPEGAIAPNMLFQFRDSVEVGEPNNLKIAFKNISDASFDSILVKMKITDRNNVQNTIVLPRLKKLNPGDTAHVSYRFDTRTMPGINSVMVDVNPDNDQLEQFHFNNFAYRNMYVKPDSLNPLMDVTFDGVHILNRDIVSSKPAILVKLKDEARWMILDDTTAFTLSVRFPDGSIRPFHFNNDTMRFTPAGAAPNNDNTASIDFKPYFPQDGDYELIVSGKDKSNNGAGRMEYRVGFQVINKPMISNMLNYPNPFTTSTAFVFTVTGSEPPQNIRIQILTVTGKIVREITKDELGPIHIGRNITEFKWDGTDQYGQKLANGIYLYRVITNLNGKALDKYKAEGDNTDQYFNKGYGKMYLMR